MRNAFIASIFAIVSILSGFAEEIAVPIQWQRSHPIKGFKYQVNGIGMYSDATKYVWAVRISNLKELCASSNFLVGIYSDVDNDKNTGRFPGQAGWDFQINVNVNRKTISVMKWIDSKKCIDMPLYIDDYLVETEGDILYVAVRKEPVNRVKFGATPSMRIIGGAIGKKVAGVDIRLNLSKSSGTFEPKLKFIRFGGERQVMNKTSEAVIIPRGDKLKVWNTYGERYEEKEPMPKVVDKVSSLKISAARGESESAFFAVTADQPLESLEVTPTELKSDSGKVIPANEMKVRYIGFTGTLREEFFTDILSPVFMKSNSVNNFVAVRVNTPRGIPSGVYRGELKLKVNGKAVSSVPFELEVYDFDLPDRPYYKTAYCIKPGYIKNYFKNRTLAEYKAEEAAQNKLAKEFRFSPRLFPAGPSRCTWRNGELIIDWTHFDKIADQYFNQNKFTVFQDATFQLGSHGTPYDKTLKAFKLGTPEFEHRFGQIVKQTYEHYKKLGILDKTLFIFWDEPYSTVYPHIKNAIEVAHKNAPEIQAGVFIGHLEPELAQHVDVWLSSFGTVAKLRANPVANRKRAWTYNDVGVGNFKFPASVPRLYYWLALKYRIEGYLYSEINVYQDQNGVKRGDVFYNKWVNHCWFYPGAKPGETMPSLRMELSRDGLDDYDYMMTYKTLARSEAFPPFVEKAMPSMDKEGIITFNIKTNRELQKIRNSLAHEIVRLKNKSK